MAARNAEIVYKPFYEGKRRHKDFYKREMATRSAENVYKAFYKGKCNYTYVYTGNWPRAARKCFETVVH